jgi:hypothetical protein
MSPLVAKKCDALKVAVLALGEQVERALGKTPDLDHCVTAGQPG